MSGLQAIILAIVQGITELFPISSLGHAVILPAVLRWPVDENAEGFLPFLAVMHLGTAIALLAYFWRDWAAFAGGVLRFGDPGGAADRRLFWRVVVATLPAVVIGFVFEKTLRAGFGAPLLAAAFLIVNGIMLFAAERLRRSQVRALSQLTWLQAVIIGFWQCLALIPGLSRSGATMAGGYLCGLNHEDSARFSFLTATPIILGAVVLEAPKLIRHHSAFGATAILAGVVAGVTALVSVIVLMRWFKTHEVKGFDPFAAYCVLAGAASLAWLLIAG
ncbi:MAG TPA: undecaprenyl-diphosphate phosphatase [Caulobacteraceae bacterium]|jgi:undecaprenyl-diphosphatase|nr:undecaprenyl-diphosphate phosphatase [Caulobacteraceae bacterium]